MNNIDRKKITDRYNESVVQPLLAGFSVLVIVLAFGVIFFINPGYEVKKVVYACGEPTETPLPSVTKSTGALFEGTSDSGTTIKQRHDNAVSYLNNNYLNDPGVMINLTSPASVSSVTQVGDWYGDLDDATKGAFCNELGANWSSETTPILFVNDIGVDSRNEEPIALTWWTGTANSPGKRLIIMERQYTRSIFDRSAEDAQAKALLHELFHCARLNHTGTSINIMYEGGNSGLIADCINEVTGSNGYTFDQGTCRDQKQTLRTWDGYP